MVDKIIAEYLKTGRRLIIPELGVFIKREDRDEVIFSTLLTKNDGILLQMIQDRIQMSEEKAGIILHHFVSDVNNQLDATGKCPIEGLGMLVKSGNDIGFFYSGDRNVELVYRQRMAAIQGNSPTQPQRPQQPRQPHAPEVVSAEQRRPSAPSEERSGHERRAAELPDERPIRQSRDTNHAPTTKEQALRNNPARGISTGTKHNGSQPSEPTERGAEKSPVSSLKKTTHALFSNDAPTMEPSRRSRQEPTKRRPAASTGKRNEVGKKGIDAVLLCAIIAAAIAVGVIIYGVLSNPKTESDTLLIPTTPIENTVSDGTSTDGDTKAVTSEESAAASF